MFPISLNINVSCYFGRNIPWIQQNWLLIPKHRKRCVIPPCWWRTVLVKVSFAAWNAAWWSNSYRDAKCWKSLRTPDLDQDFVTLLPVMQQFRGNICDAPSRLSISFNEISSILDLFLRLCWPWGERSERTEWNTPRIAVLGAFLWSVTGWLSAGVLRRIEARRIEAHQSVAVTLPAMDWGTFIYCSVVTTFPCFLSTLALHGNINPSNLLFQWLNTSASIGRNNFCDALKDASIGRMPQSVALHRNGKLSTWR